MRTLLVILCLTSCAQHMTPVERAKINTAIIYQVLDKVERGERPEPVEINDAINELGNVKQAQAGNRGVITPLELTPR